MAIVYKVNILEKLKVAGYSTYKLRQEKILGERTIQQLRDGIIVSWESINRICALLHCQVGDLVEYTEEVAE
jgi:putative transcriptional regulator